MDARKAYKRLAVWTAIFLFCLTGNAMAQPENIVMVVQKQKPMNDVTIVEGLTVLVEPAYTLVPLRALSDAMGYSISWNERDKNIALSKVGMYVELRLGSNRVKANGVEKALQVVPRVVDGVTYVPMQFVTDCLGMYVKLEKNADDPNSSYLWIAEYQVIDAGRELEFAEATENYFKLNSVPGDRIGYELKKTGETEKGIFIGSPDYHVLKAYGQTSVDADGSYVYLFRYDPKQLQTTGKIVFEMSDGFVSGVKVSLGH